MTVNPAAANDTAVATDGMSKCSHLGHGTPTYATANNTTELKPSAAVAVHPATSNDAYVPSGRDMTTTVGSNDSIEYVNSTIFSSLSPPPPAAAEVPSLSLNLLDGEISASNTRVDKEITRAAVHAANTTSGVETIMDTATKADGTIASPLPSDSVTLQKLNDISTIEKCSSDTNTLPMSTK